MNVQRDWRACEAHTCGPQPTRIPLARIVTAFEKSSPFHLVLRRASAAHKLTKHYDDVGVVTVSLAGYERLTIEDMRSLTEFVHQLQGRGANVRLADIGPTARVMLELLRFDEVVVIENPVEENSSHGVVC